MRHSCVASTDPFYLYVDICQERATLASSREAAFTARFIQAHDESGLGQSVLAKAVGVSQSQISEWRDGTIPRGEALLRLPAALGVNGHWLLTGNGPKREAASDLASGVREGFALAVLEMRGALDRLARSPISPDAVEAAAAALRDVEQTDRVSGQSASRQKKRGHG